MEYKVSKSSRLTNTVMLEKMREIQASMNSNLNITATLSIYLTWFSKEIKLAQSHKDSLSVSDYKFPLLQ